MFSFLGEFSFFQPLQPLPIPFLLKLELTLFLVSFSFSRSLSSSNAMPRAVKAALAFCLTSEGGMSEGEAKTYLEGMEVEGRLSEECWS